MLADEAERAAALAGEAFKMASRAQHMLDEVARTTSRCNTASQPGSPAAGGYGAPAQPWAVAAPPPALGAETSQPGLVSQSSQVFTGPCSVNYNMMGRGM